MLHIDKFTFELKNEDNETFEMYMEKAYGLRITKKYSDSKQRTSFRNMIKQQPQITIIDMWNKQFIYPNTQQIVSYGDINEDGDINDDNY